MPQRNLEIRRTLIINLCGEQLLLPVFQSWWVSLCSSLYGGSFSLFSSKDACSKVSYFTLHNYINLVFSGKLPLEKCMLLFILISARASTLWNVPFSWPLPVAKILSATSHGCFSLSDQPVLTLANKFIPQCMYRLKKPECYTYPGRFKHAYGYGSNFSLYN